MSENEDKEDKLNNLISSLYEIIELLQTKKNVINFHLKDFTSLRQILKSDVWPKSVNLDNFDEKEYLEKFLVNVINIDNLDVLYLGKYPETFQNYVKDKNPSKAVAYYEESTKLNKNNNYKKDFYESSTLISTTNFNDVIKEAPYDVIIIYDFIEHTNIQMPVDKILGMIKNLRKNNGPIYFRAHPFCSRFHDHNNYHSNKAYSHLVFSEKEKLKIGCLSGQRPCRELLTETDYFKLFFDQELEIKERKLIEHSPEKFFFEQKLIAERIKDTLNTEIITPEEIGLEFIDYVLS